MSASKVEVGESFVLLLIRHGQYLVDGKFQLCLTIQPSHTGEAWISKRQLELALIDCHGDIILASTSLAFYIAQGTKYPEEQRHCSAPTRLTPLCVAALTFQPKPHLVFVPGAPRFRQPKRMMSALTFSAVIRFLVVDCVISSLKSLMGMRNTRGSEIFTVPRLQGAGSQDVKPAIYIKRLADTERTPLHNVTNNNQAGPSGAATDLRDLMVQRTAKKIQPAAKDTTHNAATVFEAVRKIYVHMVANCPAALEDLVGRWKPEWDSCCSESLMTEFIVPRFYKNFNPEPDSTLGTLGELKVVVKELKKKKSFEITVWLSFVTNIGIEQPLSLTTVHKLHRYGMYWEFSGS
ncbi:hypothetical protein GGX14DRAFT_388293 [Mycena pura]|uniref:Uncharacterized protein n=1 Tax=Mycena pura TaxID=153505 RepID=A0AAD6YLD3_9AGAR|nr:hypothetical protein GGX14DRAFT_388293 [Mycena pura]